MSASAAYGSALSLPPSRSANPCLWLRGAGSEGWSSRRRQWSHQQPGTGPAGRDTQRAGPAIAGTWIGWRAPDSSNKQSVDLTSTAMRAPGGRILIGIAGLVLIGVGAWLAWRAFQRKFLSDLRTGEMSPRTRKVVTFLGRYGGIARGIVFGA